jgi:hypothetical protein
LRAFARAESLGADLLLAKGRCAPLPLHARNVLLDHCTTADVALADRPVLEQRQVLAPQRGLEGLLRAECLLSLGELPLQLLLDLLVRHLYGVSSGRLKKQQLADLRVEHLGAEACARAGVCGQRLSASLQCEDGFLDVQRKNYAVTDDCDDTIDELGSGGCGLRSCRPARRNATGARRAIATVACADHNDACQNESNGSHIQLYTGAGVQGCRG